MSRRHPALIGGVKSPNSGTPAKLMPPKYAKAYVTRGKTDPIDAAAICEAVTRPSMSFVPVKGVEQQGVSMLHGARSQLIGKRTQLINAARAPERARHRRRKRSSRARRAAGDRP